MPSYTVPINGPNGPGFITVNASSPAAAQDNASQGGNHATGPAVSGGHQATTGAGGTAVPSTSTPTSTTATTPSSVDVANQYAAAIQQAQAALAAGNREAFQRAIYEWDQTFGFDKEKFAEDTRRFNEQFGVTQAGLTGTYKDQPTLPALTSYANQFGQWGVPTTGQQTLAAQNQYFTQGLQGIQAASALQANPFRQQQVLGQLSGLYGNQGVAGFQAPNQVQGVGTVGGNTRGGLGYMQQMIDDIKDPTANQTSVNSVLDATPTPNKLNSTEFLRSAPSTQQMVLQAMQEKYGLDPNDSLKQIQATLPQFQAPSTLAGFKR